MSNPLSPASKPARQLLTGPQVQKLFAVAQPEYGQDFTAEQWAEIAERLSALTRLLWRIRCRQLSSAARGQEPSARPVGK